MLDGVARPTPQVNHLGEKESEGSLEHVDHLAPGVEQGKDIAEPGTVTCSEADNKRILRKTDITILSLLCMIYFLQSADKGIVGLTAVYGLKTDAHLTGNDYPNIGSIGYYAQLGVQPLAAWLVVKFKYRYILPVIVIGWAVALLGMAGSTNYGGLMAARFFLGGFEAAVVPLFSLITISFYRRSEQPLRVAMWYGCYGLSTMISAFVVYGMARAPTTSLHTYQSVYLLFGLFTVMVGIATFWWAHDSPGEARFLNAEDKLKAVDRLKANQQGIVSHDFKMYQVFEAFTEIKWFLFVVMIFCNNAGAAVSSTFGSIILNTLFGFTSDQSVLLNGPTGAVQIIGILTASYLAYRFQNKSIILFAFVIIVLIGIVLMYAVPKTPGNQGVLLFGFYLLNLLFGINPILLSWIGANAAGQTKKAVYYTTFNAANSLGNIATPYIFSAQQAPTYHVSLQAILGIWCCFAAAVVLQALNLMRLQKRKERKRLELGLDEKITDYSMQRKYHQTSEAEVHGKEGLDDRTDVENEYFTYLL